MLLSFLPGLTLVILSSANTLSTPARQGSPFSSHSREAFPPNFDFPSTHYSPAAHGGGVSGTFQNPNYGYDEISPHSTHSFEYDNGYSYSNSWKGIRGSSTENLGAFEHDKNGIGGGSIYGHHNPTTVGDYAFPSSEYDYMPSNIGEFESSYGYPSHYHYPSENYGIQSDTPYGSVFESDSWRGMPKQNEQNPSSHESNYHHQSGYNHYNQQHFHPHSPSHFPSSHGSSQLDPNLHNYQLQSIQPTTVASHKPISTPYPDYFTPEVLSPSYAPPRSLLKSVFNGISSSISSSLKPALEYLSPQSETWNPVHDQTDPIPPRGLHQDKPNPHGEKDADNPKAIKHIYIHSTSDKFPEEVNIKLILLKPSLSSFASTQHDLRTLYDENAAARSRQITPSPSFPSVFPLSDLKRSKINAQLYFVRYKSPLVPPWESHPFPSKSPTFHFLVSKRSAELGDKTQ